MNCPTWLPWLGWFDLPGNLVRAMDLDPLVQWEALSFEWFGRGMIFAVRVK